jgi:hypothetical protein
MTSATKTARPIDQRDNDSMTDAAPGSTKTLAGKVGEALERGRDGIEDSVAEARDSLSDELTRLRRDMARMQDTLSRFATDAGGHAAKTAADVGQAVAGEMDATAHKIADAGAKMTATASEHAQTFAAELEAMARRNPLSMLAGTLLAGVVLGMMSRSRA